MPHSANLLLFLIYREGSEMGGPAGAKMVEMADCTLDDSHRPATSEVVQAIKSVKENIEDCI